VLSLEYPWMFLALPLPLLVWWLLPPYHERQAGVRMPFFDQLAAASGRKPGTGSVVLRTNWLQRVLAPIVWGLLVCALARPVWVEPPIQKIESARDILLAIDLSQSMEAKDFRDPSGARIDRLTAVKRVVDDFITRRKGDRIGLVVFGGAAYPQAPFTMDHEAVREILNEVQIGMAGPQTMIGDAIGLGIKMFDKSKAKDKVVILLTDGNDTGSRMPPPKAAEIAEQRGITIHTIGIGDPRASGEEKVDLDALKKISTLTNGRFFRGEDREQLEGIYRTLDQITPQNFDSLSYRPKRPLFQWPLATAALLLAGYHALMLIWSLLRRASRPKETELAA
jgi:Ca-activated chloride channel family protein